MTRFTALAGACVLWLVASHAGAQQFNWQPGPMVGAIGDIAEIDVPEGFLYLDQAGTQQLLTFMENPVSGSELAVVVPESEDESWFLVFEWEPIGYVDDSERDDLDPVGLLESIKEGTAAGNEEREKRGCGTIQIVGWEETPHYDASTNNLTWAVRAMSEGEPNVNRMIKLLGRRGVMSATLVASSEELAWATPVTDMLLTGYSFKPGRTYAEYLPGTDKLAKAGSPPSWSEARAPRS